MAVADVDLKPPCYGRTELWFSESADDIEEAQRVCVEECPLIARCAKNVEANPQEYGVWAGLTEQDRKQPTAIRCGTPEGYRRHSRRGTPLCRECSEAWRRYQARYRGPHAAAKLAARRQAGLCRGCARYIHERHTTPCKCKKCETTP